MGTPQQYPEEILRSVTVSDFDIDIHEVTNSQFATFVDETGYVTTAEKPQVGFDVPGAAVFMPPSIGHPNWWRFVEGANWKNPEGPKSNIQQQGNYPVVQVSFEDALAYARWAKRDLPTEAQWEFAAKANSETRYVWGDVRSPDGKEMANTWQGAFPIQNTNEDGFDLRAPVGCYPANSFGLHDMIGNVWEWTKSETGQSSEATIYAIKGGSYLCAENYCARYRSAARQFQEADLPTNHIGFRTVSPSNPTPIR
ncbi:sulfatase-modifying factor 1 [Litorimonas cladophorae]|uniref:Sulfatase-modifying factor 1 n=2 Tax=Litorimonas cladophorae TaxID=1220491 RepID=A0A918KHN6_9PROT|nr:sulfatase-modifying factor 1 [Litorimonas cladophorae]